ncbi:MAG: YebC/PmpR family DNA-binding transcriptional regulator, partial [Rhodospirillales bacterium]
ANSVSHKFERVGEVYYPAAAAAGERMFEAALEAGADDMVSDQEGHAVYCAPGDLGQVRDALEKKFGPPERAKLAWRAQANIPLDEESARALLQLLGALEEHDDVQAVAANYEIADDLMARLMG